MTKIYIFFIHVKKLFGKKQIIYLNCKSFIYDNITSTWFVCFLFVFLTFEKVIELLLNL